MTTRGDTGETRAERKARQAANREATAGMTAQQKIEHYRGVSFPALGVRVKAGEVLALIKDTRLGALQGATVEFTDGGRPFRTGSAVAGAVLAGPVGLLAGVSAKQATAFIIFADGNCHEKKLRNSGEIVKAEAEAVKFRLLAAAP